MFKKMWLLALHTWILLTNRAWASDSVGQQNDMIPDQIMQIPDGMFCYFTMSECIFEENMQDVAPSAYRVGAARLVDMKLLSSNSYENLWGAYYFVQREDYSSIIQFYVIGLTDEFKLSLTNCGGSLYLHSVPKMKVLNSFFLTFTDMYAKSRDYVPFVSTMEVESIENETGICILTDVGLQPSTYPSTQDCSSCFGSGGSSDQPSASDYQQELASMDVPAGYFQTMGNLPSMQGSGNLSAQMPGSPSASLGASAKGPLGASAQGNISPTSLGASATGPLGTSAQGNLSPLSLGASATGPLGASAQGNLSPTSLGASATGPLGTSAQGNLSPTSLGASASGPTPSMGASAQGNLPRPTGSLGGGFSGGMYQPQTNFSGGAGGGGNSQQSSIPGFRFASYSGQYSFLSAQCGNSFMNYSQ